MLLGGSRLWFWAGSEGFEGRFYGGCGERKVPNEVAGRLWQAVGKVAKRRTAQCPTNFTCHTIALSVGDIR